MIRRFLMFVCVCAAATPAMAQDVVVMKNGDRISGEVKQIWDGEVFIEPEYGDEYAIDLDYVDFVDTAEPFEVDIRIGRRIESVTATLGQTPDGKAAVLDDKNVPVYPLAMVDNVQEIEDYFDWTFRTGLSVNVSEGNTDASSSRLSVYGEIKMGDHRFEALASRDEQRTDDELTKEQSQASLQHTWTYTDDWFIRTGLSWSSDPIRDLDSRTRFAVGPGYHVFDDSKRRLNLSIGPEYVNEHIGGETNNSLAIKAGVDYRQQFLADDLVVYQTTTYSDIFQGRRNRLFDVGVGFRYDITDDIYLSVDGTYSRESNPAEDRQKEDITYLLGAGLEFD